MSFPQPARDAGRAWLRRRPHRALRGTRHAGDAQRGRARSSYRCLLGRSPGDGKRLVDGRRSAPGTRADALHSLLGQGRSWAKHYGRRARLALGAPWRAGPGRRSGSRITRAGVGDARCRGSAEVRGHRLVRGGAGRPRRSLGRTNDRSAGLGARLRWQCACRAVPWPGPRRIPGQAGARLHGYQR